MKNRLWIPALLLTLSLASVRGGESPQPSPLRVGVTANFPPVIYKEADKIVGIEADLAKALGEELGRPVQFVEVPWEDQIKALTDGKTDIIMSGMSVTVPRQLRVAFAAPYMTIGQTVLVRRADANKYVLGFPAVPEGAIGVLKATTGDFLVQQEFPRNKRRTYSSPQEAATALGKKKIDLFVCDSPTAFWVAGMNEVEGFVVVPIALSREDMAWAVRKSDPELLKSVNGALEKLQKDGRAVGIIKHWMPFATK